MRIRASSISIPFLLLSTFPSIPPLSPFLLHFILFIIRLELLLLSIYYQCVWKQSKKQKNKYKPGCGEYSGYAAKVKTHFTPSIISKIETTYQSVPCLQFLERLICPFDPCGVETGTMQLVFICFCNIYVVCKDSHSNQIQIDLTMHPEWLDNSDDWGRAWIVVEVFLLEGGWKGWHAQNQEGSKIYN